MATEQEKNVLRQLFGTDDLNMLSKPLLIKGIFHENARANRIAIDLFCENSDHPAFNNMAEAQKAGLRIEKVRRISERCEIVKQS